MAKRQNNVEITKLNEKDLVKVDVVKDINTKEIIKSKTPKANKKKGAKVKSSTDTVDVVIKKGKKGKNKKVKKEKEVITPKELLVPEENIRRISAGDGYNPKVKQGKKGLKKSTYRARAWRVVDDLKKRGLGQLLEDYMDDANPNKLVNSWADLENLKYNAAVIRHKESEYAEVIRNKTTEKLVQQIKDLTDKYGESALKTAGGNLNPLKYYGIDGTDGELTVDNLTKPLSQLNLKQLNDINDKIDSKSMVELSKDKVAKDVEGILKNRYFKNVRGIEVTEYSKYKKDTPTQKDIISVDKVIDEHIEDIIKQLDGDIGAMKQFINYVTDPSFTGHYDSDQEKKKNPEKYAQDVLQRISDMKLALTSGDYKKGW